MKIVALLLPLLACAVAAPPEWALGRGNQRGLDIDNNALMVFALVAEQRHAGNASAVMDKIFPYLIGGMEFTKKMQLELLSVGGFNKAESIKMLQELMPMLKSDKKTTQEQAMALFLASKQFCFKEKNGLSRCPDEEETVLPLIAMTTERGCEGLDIETDADSYPADDICVCEEQGDIFFWVSLFHQFTLHQQNSTGAPDQLPMLLMMMMEDTNCEGKLKYGQAPCFCQFVTLGHEATLMQYLITSPKVQESLTKEQQQALKDALGTPAMRQSQTLDTFVNHALSGFTSPAVLSLLQSQGQGQDIVLKNLILSSIGLDSSMVHILLNNGFQDTGDRVALINYLTNIGTIDSSIIPFLFGVGSGREFYFANLVNSGNIDPLVALLFQAIQGGATQTQILEFLTEAIAQSRNPDYFTSLGKPYVPGLPSGIYPGSKLYFAHFETLGVDTCSLHDLRSRFDCGYIGISARECETAPYCCYNPIFLTDIEVRNSTQNQITSAIAIPWCYYNVFFVYYNSFFMTVAKPGEFASPLSCRPLFKYGLQLEPNLYHLFDQQNPSAGIGRFIHERLECGFPGMTEFHCVAIRGCCWDTKSPYRVPQCFQKNGPTGFDFTINDVPVAYRARQGTCDVNTYRIPLLYYFRVACHYEFEFYIAGYNILAIPNQIDCTTKLGCCWERDEEVAKEYPWVPRCYQREGGQFTIPQFLANVTTLISYRSGETGEDPFYQFLKRDQFPSVTRERIAELKKLGKFEEEVEEEEEEK